MNDADVSKQIQQMVRFIRQEAEEKANEISVSAEEVASSILILHEKICISSNLCVADWAAITCINSFVFLY